MPSQHVEVAETITALRRKLRRDNEVVNGDPTQMATNRGNKLRPGARFVHSGSLPYKYSSGSYKEKINHAGYQRYILGRNPKRYNEYGDELEQSESDPEADADADDENPYAEVRLEEILRPLTHPSELANNPAVSYAYLDPALTDMVAATDKKIREERNNLWRAKNLYRYFTGDESWMPCHTVEAPEDWDLFEPHARLTNGDSPHKRRKLDLDAINQENGVDAQDYMALDEPVEEKEDASDEGINGTALDHTKHTEKEVDEKDVETQQDGPATIEDQPRKTNGIHAPNELTSKSEEMDTDTGQHRDNADSEDDVNRQDNVKTNNDGPPPDELVVDGPEAHNGIGENNNPQEDGESTTSTPPPPPRRITRALAAEATNPQSQTVSPPPSSPTISSISPSAFEPHPMFLLPSSVSAFHAPYPTHPPLTFGLAHSGLPPEELLETRKLLSLFIQKSEETIRGFEGILGKLIKAKRRRDKVWEWCMAEGHLGEMSDGEDWIDHEAWGLQKDELRKGRDEDGGAVILDGTNGGAANEAGDENSGVVMGGRKGKRRRAAARD